MATFVFCKFTHFLKPVRCISKKTDDVEKTFMKKLSFLQIHYNHSALCKGREQK